MERLIDIEVGNDGTITSVIELICTMTGFRQEYIRIDFGDGYFQSVYGKAS